MEKRGKGISAGWIILIIFLAVIVLCFASCTILLFSGGKEKSLGGNVALIQIKGTIAVEESSMFGAEGTSSTEIISFLKDADRDSSIKAVVLEINSGGGSAVASKALSYAPGSSSELTSVATSLPRGSYTFNVTKLGTES